MDATFCMLYLSRTSARMQVSASGVLFGHELALCDPVLQFRLGMWSLRERPLFRSPPFHCPAPPLPAPSPSPPPVALPRQRRISGRFVKSWLRLLFSRSAGSSKQRGLDMKRSMLTCEPTRRHVLVLSLARALSLSICACVQTCLGSKQTGSCVKLTIPLRWAWSRRV